MPPPGQGPAQAPTQTVSPTEWARLATLSQLSPEQRVAEDYWSQYQQPGESGPSRPIGTAPAPSGGGQQGGGGEDPQAVFNELMQGQPLTLEGLRSIEPELQRRTGAKLEMNARGTGADLKLPNGQFIDVIGGFDGPEGSRKLQWMPESPGGGGGGYGGVQLGPNGLPAGYEMGNFSGGGQYPLASVMGPGLMQPWTTPFSAPTMTEENNPGYSARMNMGRQAIERSAAARGTLRTGGTLKDLTQFGQDYGSSEYDKVYGRAMDEYKQAYGIYDRNQSNQFSRLHNMSTMGQNAAALSAGQNYNYGNAAGGIYSQQGNAASAGTVANATAGANTWGQIGKGVMSLADMYTDYRDKKNAAAGVVSDGHS